MGKVFSSSHRPHRRVVICLIYAACLVAACGGTPSASGPTVPANLPRTPTQLEPTQQVLPSDTPVSQPTTISTEPATIEPAQPTRVQPSPQPALATTAPTQAPTSALMPVGSTVSANNWDITLYDAEIVESYKNVAGQEQRQPGWKFIKLTFGFKRVKLPENGSLFDAEGFDTHAVNPGGDAYPCYSQFYTWSPLIPEGYEYQELYICSVPVTVADASLQAEAVLQGSRSNVQTPDVQIQFALGKRTTPPSTPLILNPETMVEVGQPIVVGFDDAAKQLEFSVENAWWKGKNGTELWLDFKMTNSGTKGPNFSFQIIRPLDMANRTLPEQSMFPGGHELPPFGQTKTISLFAGRMLPPDGPVPVFLFSGNKMNGKYYLVVNVTPQRK